MELNPKHELVQNLFSKFSDDKDADISPWLHLLQDQALLAEGATIKDGGRGEADAGFDGPGRFSFEGVPPQTPLSLWLVHKRIPLLCSGFFHELASLAAGGRIAVCGAKPGCIAFGDCIHPPSRPVAGRQALACLRLCTECSLVGQTERGLQSAQFSLFL